MYFNQIDGKRASVLMSKLGGSKIPAQRRLDIERSLRVKDAVDVLDTLEDAFIEIGKALKTYAHFTKNN